jgi:hypothetical protein
MITARSSWSPRADLWAIGRTAIVLSEFAAKSFADGVMHAVGQGISC